MGVREAEGGQQSKGSGAAKPQRERHETDGVFGTNMDAAGRGQAHVIDHRKHPEGPRVGRRQLARQSRGTLRSARCGGGGCDTTAHAVAPLTSAAPPFDVQGLARGRGSEPQLYSPARWSRARVSSNLCFVHLSVFWLAERCFSSTPLAARLDVSSLSISFCVNEELEHVAVSTILNQLQSTLQFCHVLGDRTINCTVPNLD